MPKIEEDYEDDEEYEEEEVEEDEGEEEDEEEVEKPIQKPLMKNRMVKKPFIKPHKSAIPQKPKRRYAIVAAQPVRIIDAEAQEVVGEGEYLIAQALTDIIERLERIENNIGSMIEG
jgi:hypothetical protein